MTVTSSNYEPKDNDLYETEVWAVEALIRVLKSIGLWRPGTIWEPAAGNHALVRPLYTAGATAVITSDICEYNEPHTFFMDFIKDATTAKTKDDFDIVTNPPYGWNNQTAALFAERALEVCPGYVALLLTAKFDFGITRTHLFRDNARFLGRIALMDRISFAGNGVGGTEDHAWFIWGPKGTKVRQPGMFYEGKERL